jgi:hypothetical protein
VLSPGEDRIFAWDIWQAFKGVYMMREREEFCSTWIEIVELMWEQQAVIG